MVKHLDRIRNVVFGAAMVGVLSFGATQALAAPSDTVQGTRCTNHDLCDVHCQNSGYPAGKCINWVCNCLTGSGWKPALDY